MPVCKLCRLGHTPTCPLASWEAEQAAPRDDLVTGFWQCTKYVDMCNESLNPLGPSASTRRCLCAICANHSMHPHPPLLPKRENGLHHAMCWCLGARNAPNTPRQQIKANAPKYRWLFSVCAMQAMHLCVLLPTERVTGCTTPRFSAHS